MLKAVRLRPNNASRRYLKNAYDRWRWIYDGDNDVLYYDVTLAQYRAELAEYRLSFSLACQGVHRIAAALLWVLLTLSGTIAAQASDVQGLRFGLVDRQGVQATRMVIETAQPAQAQLILLENPYRIAVDIAGAEWGVRNLPPQKEVGIGVASDYRFGHPQQGLGRIVLSLSQPATPLDIFTLPPTASGHRLVVDVAPASPTDFILAKSRFNVPHSSALAHAAPQPAPVQPAAKRPAEVPAGQLNKPFIVAIDAGHGGKDPGAIGQSGTYEKHITLRTSKMLAEELQKMRGIQPVLIRSEDVYYKLRERIRRASDADADVFISLHADSAPNKKAYGISVFTLSEKASDKEAALLARNANKADLIGAADAQFEDPVVLDAFLGMRQRETKNESSRLANTIIDNIKSFPGSDKRGHRFAGFAVLKSPEIPSVLVELGFLSNKNDEKNLNDKAYLRRLIQALARATGQYLKQDKQ